jgi:hypothetical protein
MMVDEAHRLKNDESALYKVGLPSRAASHSSVFSTPCASY